MNVLMMRVGEGWGGAEVYNVNLVRGFRKCFPDAKTFFLVGSAEFSRRIHNAGSQAFLLPIFKKEIGTKKDLGDFLPQLPQYITTCLKAINSLNKREKLDAVCLQGTTEKIILTPLLKILKHRVFWLEHGPFFRPGKTKFITIAYKLLARLTEKIITVSQDSRHDLLQNGLAANKVICIPTGIDTQRFRPVTEKQKQILRHKWHISSRQKVIGFVGAICQAKGIKKFFQVSQQLLKNNKRVKFVILGKGPALPWLKQEIKKKNLTKYFILPGFKKDIRPYVKIFDLLFLPTYHHEGLSIALLEAAAMAKVIVTRDIGGNREIIADQKSGYLLKNGSIKTWTTLISNILDENDKRIKMGLAARQLVIEKFNQNQWIKKIYETFQA